MRQKHQIYLISDSTGETLDRIFLAIQSQFSNFSYEKKEFVYVRNNGDGPIEIYHNQNDCL